MGLVNYLEFEDLADIREITPLVFQSHKIPSLFTLPFVLLNFEIDTQQSGTSLPMKTTNAQRLKS